MSNQIATTKPATKETKSVAVEQDNFINYDSKLAAKPFGLRNVGSSCYYNSLIQSIMSLSSVNDLLTIESKQDLEMDKKYPMRKALRGLFAGTSIQENSSLGLATILKYAQSLQNSVKMGGGQQCAAEGFSMLLENLDAPIRWLFRHRLSSKISCLKCKRIVSSKKGEFFVLNTEHSLLSTRLVTLNSLPNPTQKKESKSGSGSSSSSGSEPEVSIKSLNLNDFLYGSDSVVMGYKCPRCGDKSPKNKSRKLVMLPEILPILFKKYQASGGATQKINSFISFPEILTFGAEKHKYQAVAQIEHSGGTSGGHYWAICKRSDSKWYNLNDSNASPSKFGPTKNTYMVFYHRIARGC
jgi:ubiquitin C-terminal hydrolase